MVFGWFTRFFEVVSWFFMVFGWFPWFFKVVSWFFMVFGWFPWFFKVFSLFFMVFGWFPWFFKVVSCKWHLISQGNPDQGYCFPKINVLSKVSTPKVHQKYEKVSEKRNKVGEKYIVVKKSELSAEGTKRDVENTPKFTRPDCILAQRSSLGPPPEGRHRT